MDEEAKRVFIAETEEMLLETINMLLENDQAENFAVRVNHVFRVVHTIKGGSQFLGFQELAELAHHMEDFLSSLRSGEIIGDEANDSFLIEVLELIETMVEDIKKGAGISQKALLHQQTLVGKIRGLNQQKVSPQQLSSIQPDQPGKPRVSHIGGKRLMYLHVQLVSEAIMPQVRMFLVLERLKEVGNVIYSLPSLDSLEMPSDNSSNEDELAIILSTDEKDEIIKTICDVGDILEVKLLKLERGFEQSLLVKQNLPTVLEVKHFEEFIAQLLSEFQRSEYSRFQTSLLVHELDSYGNKESVFTESWFPGGLAGWKRYIALLLQTVSMDGSEREGMAFSILQSLWESVFDALCNKVYFCAESMEENVPMSKSIFKERISLTGQGPQLAVLDLSPLKILEPSDLLTLRDLSKNLSLRSIHLILISSGANTRRQLNVLEASAQHIGGLRIFPNAFAAAFS